MILITYKMLFYNKTEEYIYNMTDEEYERYKLEEEVNNRTYNIYSNMQQVKQLKKRNREIRGIPEDMGWDNFRKYEQKEDFTVREINELLKIRHKLDEFYDESHKRAVSEIAKERGITEKEVDRIKYVSDVVYRPSKEVLKKAVEECS